MANFCRYSDWAGWADGNQIRDSQPFIWRWRDWIVESLNADIKVFMELMRKVAVTDGFDQPKLSGKLPPTTESFFWHWVGDPTPVAETGSSLHSNLHHYLGGRELRCNDVNESGNLNQRPAVVGLESVLQQSLRKGGWELLSSGGQG